MNKQMKIFLGVGLAALLAVAGFSLSKNTQGEKEEVTAEVAAANEQFVNYAEAVKKAKAENKLVLVDIYTDWCVWCKRMDKDVYANEAVQAEMNKYFVAAKLDAESEAKHPFRNGEASEIDIAKNLQASGYPTTAFVTADEQLIRILPGYMKAPDFVMVLRYMGQKVYEKGVNFDEWRKTQG
jgi:thioredoxin-related protein